MIGSFPKSKMDSEEHLLRICNAVGGINATTGMYEMGDEAIECLRDIKRLLRADDRTDEKFLLCRLGEWQFMQTDLVPIVLQCPPDMKLLMVVVELLVPLTWPVDKAKPYAIEQSRYLVAYKELLSDQRLLSLFFSHVLAPLSKNGRYIAF